MAEFMSHNTKHLVPALGVVVVKIRLLVLLLLEILFLVVFLLFFLLVTFILSDLVVLSLFLSSFLSRFFLGLFSHLEVVIEQRIKDADFLEASEAILESVGVTGPLGAVNDLDL